MGLARVTTQLAQVIIRMLGDNGGTLRRDVESELDNIIAWAKDAPRCIHRSTTATGTITTGLDSLHSFTLTQPNRLMTNGDFLRFTYAGLFSSNDANKRIVISADGQTFEDFGLFDFDAGLWRACGEYTRIDSTHLRASYWGAYGEVLVADEAVISGTPDIIYLARNQVLTVSDLSANDIVFLVQAESNASVGTGTDDIVQNLSIIEVCLQ